MAIAALGLIGGLVSAGGTLLGGYAQQQSLNYQSQVAFNNAIIANRNAAYVMEATNRKVADVSMAGAEKLANLKAEQAAGGVDVNTGSNAQVQSSQREVNKLDALTAMNQGQVEEYGYKTQATNYTAQSKLAAFEAPQAMVGAELGAAGTVLGAGAKWLSPPGLTGA